MTFVTGTAYVHGMQHARGNFIIIMDADLSHHVSFNSLACMLLYKSPSHVKVDNLWTWVKILIICTC